MANAIPDINDVLQRGIALFRKEFQAEPTAAGCAPGRVNLIGEHTDYNEGFVLPMALPLVTIVIGRAVPGDIITIATDNPDCDPPLRTEFKSPHNGGILEPGKPKWSNYVKGVVAHFPVCRAAFQAVVVSSVPTGGGISSSAALEVATYTFLEAIYNVQGCPADKALVCQKAENTFAGMPCGIMDQFTTTLGKEGNALLIDCRSFQTELVPINDSNIIILITNSKVKHELTGSEYSTRRAQCFEAANLLGLKSLRDATSSDLAKLEKMNVHGEIIRRARHVIGEIERTVKAAEMLKAQNYEAFGQLMVQSHASLRDDFEVSCPELDVLVEAAVEVDGVFGSRMTGGGFGGCTVTLVKKNAVDQLIENIKSKYSGTPEFFVSVPSEGARQLPLPPV